MTYKNFFQSSAVNCETDNYDIQVLKISDYSIKDEYTRKIKYTYFSFTYFT